MKDRIAKIIEEEGLSATRFAEEIGVQASSISHIVSGRNKPSTDFLMKLLERFRGLNAEWLLTGRGNMFKGENELENIISETEKKLFTTDSQQVKSKVDSPQNPIYPSVTNKDVEKIIIFYKNKTFKTYFPD